MSKEGEQERMRPVEETKAIDLRFGQGHERVEESSFESLDPSCELPSQPRDLPGLDGETRIVLLPIEPYMVHVYWQVAAHEGKQARHQLGSSYRRSRAVLRFYDVTKIVFDGTNAHGSFDVHIDLQAKNWYVHLWSPDKSYFVELGFKIEDSRFFPLVRSNTAHTPPAWLAHKAGEQYMLVKGDYEVLKAVPDPIDARPLCKADKHTASQPEPISPSAEENHVFQSTRPSAQDSHLPYEREGGLDLAEISEKEFRSGVSSRQNRSCQINGGKVLRRAKVVPDKDSGV